MDFQKINPFGKDAYTYWISGIYKIVSYSSGRYHAFYIVNGGKNWGDHVCKPPLSDRDSYFWPSLSAAVESCKEHAAGGYEPTPKTIKRAAEVRAALIEQEKEYK